MVPVKPQNAEKSRKNDDKRKKNLKKKFYIAIFS